MSLTGFGEIAEKLRRSTVLIQVGDRGGGSGVIWTSDGTVITNAHVARGSRMCLQLWDGRECSATVASRDSRRDLTMLRICATNPPAAMVADSSQVRQVTVQLGAADSPRSSVAA